jgi:hypothetical protein
MLLLHDLQRNLKHLVQLNSDDHVAGSNGKASVHPAQCMAEVLRDFSAEWPVQDAGQSSSH